MEEQSQSLLDQIAFFNDGADDIPEPTTRSKAVSRNTRPLKKSDNRKRSYRGKTASDQEWEEF
ncbi:MAG: hypothetical protein P8I03_08515 [Thalassotalea sp.]|nr:hypothetical protein [Thalassotalea sp.]